VVERLLDETAIALSKGDNTLALMQARFVQAWLADYETGKRLPQLVEKYKSEMPPAPSNQASGSNRASKGGDFFPSPTVLAIIPIRLLAVLEEPYTPEQEARALEIATATVAQLGRGEHDALAEAVYPISSASSATPTAPSCGSSAPCTGS
jgi:hypothetical protein